MRRPIEYDDAINGQFDTDVIWFSAQFDLGNSTVAAQPTVFAAISSVAAPAPAGSGSVSLNAASSAFATNVVTSASATAVVTTTMQSPVPIFGIAAGNEGALPILDLGLQALAQGASATAPLSRVVGGLSLAHAPNAISRDGQYVTIDATAADGDGAALLIQLQAIGLRNGASFRGMASGQLPVDKVNDLLDVANLAYAHESGMITRAGLVTTLGDVAMHADTARSTFGVDGTGITIGVLSDSFNTSASPITTMAQDIANDDLPVNTTILEDSPDGTDEGRAIAQLIHDFAPGATILFATGNNGQASFASNIIALANAGAQVIIDDLAYFFEPMFQDGVIAQAIDQVVANGVIYFSSAGNEGHAGYESPFIGGGTGDIGGVTETFHDFGTTVSGVPSTLLQITQDDDTTYIFQWANAAASASPGVGAVTNLDFAGYSDAAATDEIFHFSNVEIGGDPINDLNVTGAATFYLRIGLASGPAPVALKIVARNDAVTYGANTTNINDGTTYGHNSAAGAIAVGAADYRRTPAFGVDPPLVEHFSSGGPTNIWVDAAGNILSAPQVRAAPAFTAPDGGDTSFFFKDNSDDGTFPNFFGTSASAPAAAAVAALMLQARPALTRLDIQNLLQDSAIDMDNPATAGFDVGYDFGTGAGLIQADLAVGYASTLTITATAAHPVMYGTHLADTFISGAENDTFTGFGGIDILKFAPGGLADTYRDFIAGVGGDIVNLTAFANITTLQAVLNRASQSGADALINLGNGDIITLAGVTIGNLTRGNFLLSTPNDFNGDAFSDVLWRHDNGSVSEWQMNGHQIVDNVGVGLPSPAWHFQDTGDFNADGKADILWRHDSGQVVLWTLNGNQVVANESVATLGNDWHNEGAADFGGDGRSDVLWHNDSGQIALWTMNGAQITNNQVVGNLAAGWHVQGLLDAGGDGKSDVLLRHDSGQVVLWTMNGAQITANQSVANLGLDWNIVGTGDFGGDGKGDVLLRNDNGQVALWTMDGNQIVANQSVGMPGNDWEMQDVGDYNLDGKSDVLWRSDSGQVVVWEMNGAQIVSNHTVTYQGGVPAPIGLDWAVLTHHYDVL